jgi:hypothetical protein
MFAFNCQQGKQGWTKSYDSKTNAVFFPFIVPCRHAISLIQYFLSGISSFLHRNSWKDNWFLYVQTLYINETHTHISKTEFVTSFLDVNMSDFDLYILKKYLFIPLLVSCIPILWGPALQCTVQGSYMPCLPLILFSAFRGDEISYFCHHPITRKKAYFKIAISTLPLQFARI